MDLPVGNAGQNRDDYLFGRRAAWFAYCMTVALMVFDYVDRQVIVSMFPFLKAEWNLSDKELGLLVSVISVTIAVFGIPVAWIADRISRVKSIVAMAVVWSIACISCMFSQTYTQLLYARAVVGLGEAGHLPNASTFCGRCESVCPVKIPLPKMMRHWREREFAQGLSPPVYRFGLKYWAWLATRPALYHSLVGAKARLLGWFGRARGRFRSLPLAGGWTLGLDMPAPEGRSFHSLWAERQRRSRTK